MDSLVGVTASDWFRILKKNNFAISFGSLPKALILSILTIRNSLHRKKENEHYFSKIEKTEIIKDPIFLLGHWRSGTTFLHNLFILDDQFAFPNSFEVNNPHTFLYRGEKYEKYLQREKAEKRPMDNIQITPFTPGEEEFALGALTLNTPLLAWPFPDNEKHYDQFLTFNNVSENVIKQWKECFLLFIKKLTLKYNKQLILKNPSNTGRLKLLYELFPNAKFVHIHRNPYTVFQSTQKLYKTAVSRAYFHKPPKGYVNPGIIKRYKEMYDNFFKEKELIPKEQFTEICFEDLERNLLPVMKSIYEKLNIPGFANAEPVFEEYMKANKNYKKNKHVEIDGVLKKEIATKWQKCFTEWGYEI